MVLFPFKHALYLKLPPHVFNQTSDLLINSLETYETTLSDDPYSPSDEDQNELARFNFLPPWYLIPFLENSSGRSSWFIRSYSWFRLYVESDPNGPFVFPFGTFSIYHIFLGHSYPWNVISPQYFMQDDLVWFWLPPPPKPTLTLSFTPRPVPIQDNIFAPLQYLEKAYAVLCPESLKYVTEEEDTVLIKRSAADTLVYNSLTTLYAENVWSPVPPQFQEKFTKFNIVITRMLYKYKKVEIRVKDILYFPYLWNCRAFKKYYEKMVQYPPNVSIPFIEEVKERENEYFQKVQANKQI